MLDSSNIASLQPSICDSSEYCVGVEDNDTLTTRRSLYLSGFLLIDSITDARANRKSTLPFVRTLLTSSSTVFLI